MAQPAGRKRMLSFRTVPTSITWVVPPKLLMTSLIIIIVAILMCFIVMDKNLEKKNASRLISTYNKFYSMMGHSYSTVPFVDPSIFQYPDPNPMAKSHGKQKLHNMISQPVSLDELLNVSTGDRILIIGEPGTGKTRLALEIMKRWTDNEALPSCELLFVYRLRWFSLQNKELNLTSIVSLHMERSPVVDEIVNEVLRTDGKNICFLFDGLDEYVPGYSNAYNYINRLIHRQVLSNAVVIVTTRRIISKGFDTIRWTQQYHITGFSDEGLKHYLGRIQKDINLWFLCKLPLYASLFKSAFGAQKRDSTIITATDLFTVVALRTFESDLRKANKPIMIEDLKHLLEFPVLREICALAFKGSLNTPKQYSFLDSEVPPELKGSNLSFFQIEPQPGAWNMEVYTFIHPTLMDFLAAVYLTSLSETTSEQVVAIEKYCLRVGTEYEDFWRFFCGLTSQLKPKIIKLIHNCRVTKHQFDMQSDHLTMAHCIFEAQSHSAHEVESAAHYLMQEMEGHLIFTFLTLSVYDMQAIGFFASTSVEDLNMISFIHIIFADDLSYFFNFLAKPGKIFPNQVSLFFTGVYCGLKNTNIVKVFLKQTPNLTVLSFDHVSEPLLQLAMLAPSSAQIHIYGTNIGINSEITPSSLIKQHYNRGVLYMAKCNVKDKHLIDIQSIPQPVSIFNFGLSYNNIGNEGANSLAMSFQTSGKTTESGICGPFLLDLKYNNISGEGLVALLKAAEASCSILAIIDLTGNNITDKDVDLILKACLTFYRPFPIRILLKNNNLMKDSEEKLMHFGIPGRSQCHMYFGSGFDGWIVDKNTGPLLESFKYEFESKKKKFDITSTVEQMYIENMYIENILMIMELFG